MQFAKMLLLLRRHFIGEWYLPSMASAADPQLQQILSDHNSPRKAALCWSKFVCARISRYNMVQNQD
jgi:hypothetical protein